MSYNALVTEVSDFQRRDTSTDGLLYTLDFDCPFPWPVNPSYPIGAMMSARTGNNDATSSDDNSRTQISLGEQQVDDEGDAPAASTSKVLLENMDARDDHAPLQAGEGSRAMAIEEALHEGNGHEYPETLQEYYWECLYSAAGSSKVRWSTSYIDQHCI